MDPETTFPGLCTPTLLLMGGMILATVAPYCLSPHLQKVNNKKLELLVFLEINESIYIVSKSSSLE